MELQHKHDCETCVSLGTHENYDLYYCPDNPTVIARYGIDGDYISDLVFADKIPVLALAVVRALKDGSLTLETYNRLTSK